MLFLPNGWTHVPFRAFAKKTQKTPHREIELETYRGPEAWGLGDANYNYLASFFDNIYFIFFINAPTSMASNAPASHRRNPRSGDEGLATNENQQPAVRPES